MVGDFNPAHDSPAERAGILIGDVIVTADGKPVDQVSTLQRIIRGHKPGDVVDLEVMRYGDKKDFKVKLAEPPSDVSPAAQGEEEDSVPVRPTASTGKQNDKLGVTVQPIPQDYLQQSKLQPQYRAGLFVGAVSGRGSAFRNLFQNDIILREMAPSAHDIHTAEDLAAAVAPLKSGDVVQFKVCANPDPRTGSCPTRIVSIQIQ